MEGLPSQAFGDCTEIGVRGQLAVDPIGEERSIRLLGQMNPNLMRPARSQPAPHQRRPTLRERFGVFDVGDGLPPAIGFRGETNSRRRMAPMEASNGSQGRHADGDRPILAIDTVVGELQLQPLSSWSIFRHDQYPARVLVEAMNDPGAKSAFRVEGIAGRTAEPRPSEQPVHQGALLQRPGGVHCKPGGLVDHDEMVVLENHSERDGRVGLGRARQRGSLLYLDDVPRAHGLPGLGSFTAHRDAPLQNPTLERLARVRQSRSERPIQPVSRSVRLQLDAPCYQSTLLMWPFDFTRMSTSARS